MPNELSLLEHVAKAKKVTTSVVPSKYIGFETVTMPNGAPPGCANDHHDPQQVAWDKKRFGKDIICTKEGILIKELFRCRSCEKIEWIHTTERSN